MDCGWFASRGGVDAGQQCLTPVPLKPGLAWGGSGGGAPTGVGVGVGGVGGGGSGSTGVGGVGVGVGVGELEQQVLSLEEQQAELLAGAWQHCPQAYATQTQTPLLHDLQLRVMLQPMRSYISASYKYDMHNVIHRHA